MLVKHWNKSRNCFLYYPRLIDETGKKRLYTPGHPSKKIAGQSEEKLKREIDEIRMFPERSFKKVTFKDFTPHYIAKHASKKSSYRHYESIAKKLLAYFGDNYLQK